MLNLVDPMLKVHVTCKMYTSLNHIFIIIIILLLLVIGNGYTKSHQEEIG